MKIAICGLGRIGRALIRSIINSNMDFEITELIDIEENFDNLIYLLNYDSVYGSLSPKISITNNKVIGKNLNAKYLMESNYINLNWKNLDFEILVDCSGIKRNWDDIKKKSNLFSKKVFISHHPDNFPGEFLLEIYNNNNNKGNLFATSICDAVGIAPVITSLQRFVSINSISVISLHPWLSYQNLVDGTIRSIANPGHSWSDYALGRASPNTLIPKNTSITKVLKELYPDIESINSLSFRVPTSISTSAILHIQSSEFENMSKEEIVESLYPSLIDNVFSLSYESLVSIDFKSKPEASIIDGRFIEKVSKDILKIVVWYDNERGYSESLLRRIYSN